MAKPELNCTVVTWGDAYRLSKAMAFSVKKSGYFPDVVVAISRGGLVPARILSDILAISDLVSIKVDHWFVTGEHYEKAEIRYPLKGNFAGKKMLVVDDITDTGSSLRETVKYVSSLEPKEIKTATMQSLSQSDFTPDFTGELVKEWAWFIYPWNFYEDMCNLTLRLFKNHPEVDVSIRDLPLYFRRYYGIRVSRKKLRESSIMLVERGLARWDGQSLVPTKS